MIYLGGAVAALGLAIGLFVLWSLLSGDVDSFAMTLGGGGAVLLVAAGALSMVLRSHPSDNAHWLLGGFCGLALGALIGAWTMYALLKASYEQAVLDIARGQFAIEAARPLPQEQTPDAPAKD